MFGVCKDKDDCLAILLGFSSVANGFMFHVGTFNLRVSDLFFGFILLYWLIFKIHVRNYYRPRIVKGIAITFILFFWLTYSGLVNFGDYNDVYQDFYVKYYVNKLLWIPLYAFIFMAYGGEKFLFNVLLGISICIAVNSIFVLYEYYSIMHGYQPDYSYLEVIGIYIDSKKDDVINQNMIRPTGLMLDPNYTGGYAGIGFLFFDYLYKKTAKKKYVLYQIISVTSMFIVFSRTGLFSLVICYILSFLFSTFGNKKHQYKMLSPFVFIILISCFVLAGIYIYAFDEFLFEFLMDRLTMNDSSAGTRTLYLEYYLDKASIGQLLLGTGTSSVGLILGNDFGGIDNVWAPESNIITFFIEQGLLFLLFYFIVCYYIFRKLLILNFHYALIFAYINLIGLSYNFLGDRVFYFLFISFLLWVFVIRLNPGETRANI